MVVEFVSEPLAPLEGTRDPAALARAEPGLPPGFRWRGREYRVTARLEEGRVLGRGPGEGYLRRHTYRLAMDDGSLWSVYFLRQPPRGRRSAAPGARWFLLSITRGGS